MSFNASSVGSPGHHTASELYASLNVDYTQLNWFERNWMAWYLWIGNPVIATGIASFILHEVRSIGLLSGERFTFSYADCLFRSLHTLDRH
jgi:hypothetical protein